MRIETQSFVAPATGEAIAVCQDAVHPTDSVDAQCLDFECAVADGATHSWKAGMWARLVAQHGPALLRAGASKEAHLVKLQGTWKRRTESAANGWFERQAQMRGAGCTIAALRIGDVCAPEVTRGPFRVSSIGDTCVFQVRNDCSWLVSHDGRTPQFTDQPSQVCTTSSAEDICQSEYICFGEWLSGDRFYMLTDKLAEWALAQTWTWWTLLDLLMDLPAADLRDCFVQKSAQPQ